MKKENHIKVRFSTILLCIPAILLCAAPCGAGEVASGDILNVGTQINDYLYVFGTRNLYPGACVDYGIYAFNGSIVNIYGGEIGTGFYIMTMGSTSTAVVTVYGTGFELDGVDIDPSASKFNGVLTGTYGGENGGPISLKFISSVPIHLVNLDDDEVDIDIKPGGNPNNINLRSNGVVPVAVLTKNGFNASTVDPDSVEFAGAEPVRWKLEDVDEDGDLDMLFHFKTQDLRKDDENNPEGLDVNSTEATLTATLIVTTTSAMTSEATSGEAIQGTDEVCIRSGKNKK
jgi:hypothetical protein